MDHLSLFSRMLRTRFFEEALIRLSEEDLIYGTYHLSIGQEGISAGAAAALDSSDWIVPTHRCHGYNAARGSDLRRMFSEILGSRDGLCRGLGGSMHMTDISTCNLGSSAVVGSGIGLAGGVAAALRMMGRKSIAVAVFGDGASSRGILYEVMNAASIWHLPLLFLLENNHYGMSASADRMISTDAIYRRAEGFSIPSECIDGNDVLSVIDAITRARNHILSEHTPYFIEAETYRQCGHSRSDHLVYRTREEENEWRKRDPIALFRSSLTLSGFSESELSAEEARVRKEMDESLAAALALKDDTLSKGEMLSLVYAPSHSSAKKGGEKSVMTYREAIRRALGDILSSDSKAFLMGEDIGKYGGCFGVTGDLFKRFPDRVIETPVSEEGFTSMAAGAAMMGMHPIVEIMYGDFSTLASDALVNHAAKARFMSGGQLSCPMILRTPIGGLTGHGPQHTQSLETMFLGIPGLKAVAPSDPYSAAALLRGAAEDGNPVLFFEHKALYGESGIVDSSVLPLGKAIVSGSGDDLLVIGYSRAASAARTSLSGLADRITFIDLATIFPLDEETIRAEYSRIGKALIVEDTPSAGSVGECVLALLSQCPCYHPGSVRLLSALPMPLPCPRKLEEEVLVSDAAIREAAAALLGL